MVASRRRTLLLQSEGYCGMTTPMGQQADDTLKQQRSGVLALTPHAPDPSLGDWMTTRLKSVRGMLLLLVSVAAAVYNAYVALRFSRFTPSERLLLLYGTQAAVILLIVALIAFGPKPRVFRDKNPRGSAAIEQFWKWWPGLWVTWLFLYGALTTAGVLGIDPSQPRALVVFHFVNNCATLMLLMCYHVLAEPTFPDERFPVEGDFPRIEPSATGINPDLPTGPAQVSSDRAHLVFWGCLFVIATLAELAIALSPPTGPLKLSADGVKDTLLVFGIAYGVLAAIATALLVGQLDSTLLGVPKYAIILLFLYAGIQPTYDVVLSSSRGASPILTAASGVIVTVALLGKLCLFATVQWLALTNRLFYFMVQHFTMYRRVGFHRGAFIRERL
jgi:hypothetical protein